MYYIWHFLFGIYNSVWIISNFYTPALYINPSFYNKRLWQRSHFHFYLHCNCNCPFNGSADMKRVWFVHSTFNPIYTEILRQYLGEWIDIYIVKKYCAKIVIKTKVLQNKIQCILTPGNISLFINKFSHNDITYNVIHKPSKYLHFNSIPLIFFIYSIHRTRKCTFTQHIIWMILYDTFCKHIILLELKLCNTHKSVNAYSFCI